MVDAVERDFSRNALPPSLNSGNLETREKVIDPFDVDVSGMSNYLNVIESCHII
jgi:hypothetical protein